MGNRKNYVVEKMRKADEIASRSSGVTRSEAESAAEKKAWGEAFDAQKTAEEVGAGRGKVNPPVVKPAPQYSPQVQEAIQEAQDAKDREKIKAMGYAKGGKTASSRADGIAQRGKTRGTIVMCGGGMYKK